ncbi:MAG: ATP-binding protein [Williamsia sp.]|nr:ATP-binding protein [Williamsia sp.]
MDFQKIGKRIDDIPVKISYRIIELFSGGLYSSPNKAFEELVSNSYDAKATKVVVSVPTDRLKEKATLWVCDNGDSMDRKGLKSLWNIGESTKQGERKNGDRLQIGKFGIGKLATYILTYKLTYICKSVDGYYAVTMDYSNITKSTEELILDEIELTEKEAKDLIEPYVIVNGRSIVPFEMWGPASATTWTFTIMTNLKPKAAEIQEGRLKWILSTALPLNPSFKLYFNGNEISSTKEKTEILQSWVFGEDDKVVEKNAEYTLGVYKGQSCVDMPNLKNVVGRVDLYKDSLVKGKSEDWGRSNGIFLMIRGRLVNLEATLPGMTALSHGVFNRIRITVHADDLDDYITSTRENIKESPPFEDMKRYVQRKFTEAKEYYFNQIETEERLRLASYKIANASSGLSRRPILVAARKFFAGEIGNLILTTIPNNLDIFQKEAIIKGLEDDLSSKAGMIKDVKWVALNPEDPIAKLDLTTRIAHINLMHPFFANFIEDVKNPLPFELFALAEILTEVSLVEQGVNEDDIKEIIYRRDRILRELTFSDKQNAPAVASLLRATLNDPDGLEDSVTKSFSSIGFETIPIGGNGKPDGKAVAYLEHKGSRESYSLTYDAKSTSKERIMAATAHISGVDRHRRDYQADYAVIVAIGFQGADDPDSAINKEAKNLKVNLIKAQDLWTLILLAGPKQLGLMKLRALFEHCHTVIETSQWIEDLKNSTVEQGPVKEILETAYELIRDDNEKPNVTAIRMVLKARYPALKNITSEQIRTYILSLKTIVPNFISFENDELSLQNTPAIIMSQINQISTDASIPFEFRDIFIEAFSKP